MNPFPVPVVCFFAAIAFLMAIRYLVLRAVELDRLEAGSCLYNRAGFDKRGNALLALCQDGGRPLSVVVFDFADLLEVRDIYGSEIARRLTARVVRKLAAVTGSGGFAARTGPAEFTLVIPYVGRDKMISRIRRVMGSPMRIEFDAGDHEIVMVPEFQIETADAYTLSVGELHGELRSEIAAAQAREQRRHQLMQRERERHSRPMGLAVPAMPTPA